MNLSPPTARQHVLILSLGEEQGRLQWKQREVTGVACVQTGVVTYLQPYLFSLSGYCKCASSAAGVGLTDWAGRASCCEGAGKAWDGTPQGGESHSSALSLGLLLGACPALGLHRGASGRLHRDSGGTGCGEPQRQCGRRGGQEPSAQASSLSLLT